MTIDELTDHLGVVRLQLASASKLVRLQEELVGFLQSKGHQALASKELLSTCRTAYEMLAEHLGDLELRIERGAHHSSASGISIQRGAK
jgi:hypothetical protein